MSLLFLLSALLVVTAFGLVEDSLFFQSDLESAFIVVMVLSGIVFFPLAAVLGGLWALKRGRRAAPVSVLGRAAAIFVAGDFIYFILAGLDKEFRIFGLFRKLDAEYLFVVLWALCLGLVWYLLSRARGEEEIARRTSLLALTAVPLALVVFAGLLGFKRPADAEAVAGAPGAPRHAVLVILDGWPAQHLRAFNPAARAKPVDELFSKALVFSNARTNSAWTNAFFGTLYKGSLSRTYTRLGLGERLLGRFWGESENLLALLQGRGVKTRVIAFHRNGLPEGSSSTVSNYRGFRSVFVTFEHASALDALGLEYNLIIPGAAANTIWGDRRKRFVRGLLGAKNRIYENVLTEVLLSEMHRIRRGGRQTFTIFHTGWELGSVRLPAAWDQAVPKGNEGEVTEKARTRDYRYDAEDEWYAERMRYKQDLVAETVGLKIQRFIEAMEADGLSENTLLIFTADHGSIYADGRVWYGFHPNEEVLRVPFVVFGAGRTGDDGRLLETIDIVQTFIDYFGGKVRLHQRARSIFETTPKPLTTSVTLRSDINREWFIALYKGDRKYLFNLHPEGDGKSLLQTVERFEVKTIAEGPKVVRSIAAQLAEALADYRIADGEVHPNFRRATLSDLAQAGD
ncbi:MAG: sulfatase-like hydrolase/transferase [Proteobacteria bacterium]|nr:sulfatase-like hydrolase/transferase [Pseudomonadota bacterium]